MTRAQEQEKRLGDATANVVTQNRPRWFAWLKSDKTRGRASTPPTAAADPRSAAMPADEKIILRSRHEARACAQDPMVAGGRVRARCRVITGSIGL
jgi:hypothetical protein